MKASRKNSGNKKSQYYKKSSKNNAHGDNELLDTTFFEHDVDDDDASVSSSNADDDDDKTKEKSVDDDGDNDDIIIEGEEDEIDNDIDDEMKVDSDDDDDIDDDHDNDEIEEEDEEDNDDDKVITETTKIGLEDVENKDLFLKCLNSILTEQVPKKRYGSEVLSMAKGSALKRIKRLEKENQEVGRDIQKRKEKILLKNQNYEKPSINSIGREGELLKIARAGVVKVLNAAIEAKKISKKEEEQKSGYEALDKYNFDL